MAETAIVAQPVRQGGRWKRLLGLGIVLLVLGLAGLTLSAVLEFSFVVVFGPMLLATSLYQFVAAAFAEDRKEKLLHLAATVPEAVLGFLLMARPPQTAGGLIGLVAVALVVIGLARLAGALATLSTGRSWIVVSGIVALLLGVSVLVGWPAANLWLIGLCLGFDLMCHGVAWAGLALVRQKAHPA